MDVKVVDLEGRQVGQLHLEAPQWVGAVNTPVLSQAVAMYRTNMRAGLASTKTRGRVAGGGKKPWRQKHTGRARAGSIRSPLWRGGGSIFGPRPRDMSYRLPKAIRRKALVESLKGKLRDDELVVLEGLRAEAPKTKPFRNLEKQFKVARRSLIVLGEVSEALEKSLRNLEAFGLRRAADLHAFDVLNAEKVLVTKDAMRQLDQRALRALRAERAEQETDASGD